MERIDGVLDGVDYHQLYLVADEDLSGIPEGSFEDEIDPHTLAVPMDHCVCVITGIAMGQVNLTIEVLDEAPDRIDDRRPWEAVSEVSFEAISSTARIVLLDEGPESPFESFTLAPGIGWYRARAHAVGRSLDFDAVVSEDPREAHLLQLWHTDGFQPARHHRADDRWAGQWAKPWADENGPREVNEWDVLTDQIAVLDPEGQRRVAHWAASAVCELAGATALDWGPALEALRQDKALPAPFDDPAEAWTRLNQWLRMRAGVPDGVSVPAMSHPAGAALRAILRAADPNPTDAAVGAIYGAASAYEGSGMLIAAVRHEFGLS